jgi:hypothetical protein
MDGDREKPWRRNVANLLVVNSIYAAIAAITIQTIVTSEGTHYGTFWLLLAVMSLFCFVVSTEQLGESLIDDKVSLYIRSSLFYNFGVLFLFLDLGRLVQCYASLSPIMTGLLFFVTAIAWLWIWGRDTLFLLIRDAHFQRWRDRIDGERADGEILDHVDRFWIWIRIRRHRD